MRHYHYPKSQAEQDRELQQLFAYGTLLCCVLLCYIFGVIELIDPDPDLYHSNVNAVSGYGWLCVLAINIARIHFTQKLKLFDIIAVIVAMLMFTFTVRFDSQQSITFLNKMNMILGLFVVIGNAAVSIPRGKFDFYLSYFINLSFLLGTSLGIYHHRHAFSAVFMAISITLAARLIWVVIRHHKETWEAKYDY